MNIDSILTWNSFCDRACRPPSASEPNERGSCMQHICYWESHFCWCFLHELPSVNRKLKLSKMLYPNTHFIYLVNINQTTKDKKIAFVLIHKTVNNHNSKCFDDLTWTAALASRGEAWAAGEEGKRFSMAFLDTKLLATTGRFFFSNGSSLEPSAGLFTPPTEEKWNTISVNHHTVAPKRENWLLNTLKDI